MKKKINKREEKKFQEGKNKIGNILKYFFKNILR
jgi:hypothetical protein